MVEKSLSIIQSASDFPYVIVLKQQELFAINFKVDLLKSQLRKPIIVLVPLYICVLTLLILSQKETNRTLFPKILYNVGASITLSIFETLFMYLRSFA
ncbi:hypothetical protein SY88_02800 [Clostridiales bacterium PH28_bin88]|nr:hypothetical protein SY88_02800 [Clostridiales bacterium PH28_bin88]